MNEIEKLKAEIRQKQLFIDNLKKLVSYLEDRLKKYQETKQLIGE